MDQGELIKVLLYTRGTGTTDCTNKDRVTITAGYVLIRNKNPYNREKHVRSMTYLITTSHLEVKGQVWRIKQLK